MKKLSRKILSPKRTSYRSKLRNTINEGKIVESNSLEDPLDAPYVADQIKATIEDAKFLDIEDGVLQGLRSVHSVLKREHPNNKDIGWDVIEEFIEDAVQDIELDSEAEDKLRYHLQEIWESS